MTLHDLFTLLNLLGRNIGIWHDSITLQILLGINIGVQYIKYTSEYIPKLQIHQHSLLTRKVFSWHNSSAQVFFSGSSLDQVWIFIKSGSSLDLHQVWINTGSSSSLDHHWIFIKSGSWLLYHHYKMMLSLNSRRPRNFYRANPFSF